MAMVREFERWRNEKMGRVPVASTLANHSSAYNKIINSAMEHGWLSVNAATPRLNWDYEIKLLTLTALMSVIE